MKGATDLGINFYHNFALIVKAVSDFVTVPVNLAPNLAHNVIFSITMVENGVTLSSLHYKVLVCDHHP